jgi:hypothetical protein
MIKSLQIEHEKKNNLNKQAASSKQAGEQAGGKKDTADLNN